MGAMGSGLSLGTLSIAIQASVDQALQEFQKFGADVGKVIDEQKTKWEGLATVGESMSKLGGALTLGITAPIAAIGAASVSMAADFESSMNKVQAVSSATGADMEAMRQLAMKLGADTKYSAQEAAEGMGNLASAGLTTKQTMDAMPGVLDLAAAGTLSVARAAEVTTDTLGQFGLAASSAGHVADVFAQGAAASAISAEDLAQSMKLVGPVAKLAGLSLEQATTAIALLGNSGVKASEAGTGLRGVIASLESPSKKAAAEINALGVSTKDAAGNLLPLDQIMGQLKESGAGASEIFRIFGREQASVASILMAQSGPAWAAMTKEIDNSEGAAKKMADTLNTGVTGALEQLKGSIETAGIALGQKLEPLVLSLLNAGTQLVNNFLLPAIEWFGNLSPEVQAFALTIVGLAAAIGPVILIAGQMATAIAALAPVLTAIAGAIGVSVVALGGIVIAVAAVVAALVALGVWVYQNWDAIMAVIQSGIATVVAKISEFVGWMAKIVPASSAAGIALKATAQELSLYSDKLAFSAQKHKMAKEASDDTAAAHKKAGEEAKKAGDAHADLAVGLKKTTDEHGKLTTGIGKTKKATEEETKSAKEAKAAKKAQAEALKEAAKEAKACADEFKALNDKNEILYAIAGKLSAAKQKLANDIAAAALSGHNLTKEFGDGVAPAIGKVDTATGLLITKLDALTGTNGLPKVLSQLGEVKLKMDPAVGSIASMDVGLKALGITSAREFTKIAADAQAAYDKVIAAPSATQWERDSAFLKLLEAQRQKMIANGTEIPALMEQQMKDIKDKVDMKAPDVKGAFDGMMSQVSTVITNFAQDISKALWEGDLSWGEKGKKLLISLGEAVTSAFIEPAAKAIAKFITTELADLIGSKGFAGVWDAIKGIGSAIGDLFKSGGAAASAGGGAASAGGGAASAAGGAASAVGGAALGWANLGVSVVSGVVQFFQSSEMNKTLDRIVLHTLQTANDLFNLRRDQWDRHAEYAKWKDDIVGSLWRTESLLGTAVGKLDIIATGSQMTMQLYGTDPTMVATRIATQLRMQGATA
jgi:TP901 family phage tail tape measure protein